MQVIKESELDKIYGGDSVSGTFINAVVNVIEIIKDAGYSIGSGIRRICEGDLCSIK